MKYPEYDSPLNFITTNIATQVAKDLDGMCVKALQRASVDIDEGKLLEILRGDSERYRDAFRRGRETGYQERDEEIVRCKNCKYHGNINEDYCQCLEQETNGDFFCWYGQTKDI